MNGFHNEEDEERQSIIADGPSKPPKVPITRLLICTTVLSAVGGFLFGYDTGVVSGAMIQLRSHFQLNYLWQELVVSVTIAGAWAFAIVAGMATDAFGRKPVILVASFVFTVGAVLMGVAFNKGMLLGGRLIVGSGIGELPNRFCFGAAREILRVPRQQLCHRKCMRSVLSGAAHASVLSDCDS